jgi:hypothetical protein
MVSDDHDHGSMSDEERERLLREQLKQLRVVDLAYDMMVSLVSIGYQKMGLTDQTRDMRDLDDAHAAIELLRAMMEVVEKQPGAEQLQDLRSTLAQMQLGYVQALQASEDGGAPEAGSEGQEADVAAAQGDGEEGEEAGSEEEPDAESA